MKGFTPLVLGIFATLAFSWLGLAYIPDLQIGHLDPQSDEEGTDVYPVPKSGMAERGRRVYVANGCFYCHSEQVRADYAASDIDRKWGDRRSAPRDYIFDRPALLGKMRLGPDLANIGKRAPAEEENAQAQASPANSPAPSPAASATAPSPSAPSPAANAPPASVDQKSKPSPQPSNPPAAAGSAPQNVAANSPAPSPNAPSPAANTPPAPADQKSKPSPQPSNPPAAAGSVPQNVATGSPAPSPNPPASVAPSPSESPALYSAAWHHQHLYSPRSLNLDSGMPAYKFLYDKRRVGGQPAADAIKLRGEEAPGEGWEIVPTYDAKCLVAYLMSLDQSHPLKEVKSSAPASSPVAAKPAKQ